MTDWVTISSLATAGGTLVLAVATFSSVKSGNRTARLAERSLLAGLRPVLIPSREQDPMERIRFGDGQILQVPGHGGTVEERDGVIFLAIALRNGGDGLAVLHGWRARRRDVGVSGSRDAPADAAPQLSEFREQLIDLYIPSGDNGYWLGAMRDRNQPGYEEVSSALADGAPIVVDLLFGDHEGGQRTIVRFVLADWPVDDDRAEMPEAARRSTVLRYWNVDREDPR